jgi:hypothetical protein
VRRRGVLVNDPVLEHLPVRESTGAPSILLIVAYFGPLPTYVDLFFRSCAYNSTIDWLLVTDQAVAANRRPSNVRVKQTTFAALKPAFDAKLGFVTTLHTPYKLADFKPAYGVLFAEDVAGYDFWGHCDVDMIFGDVRRFITGDILREYNKVLIHGHLSLYRNCDEANRYFELDAPGVSFRDAFTSTKSRAFDEFGGIRVLLDHHKIPFFRDDRYLADINRNVYRLETVHPPNFRHQCFYWQNGAVYRDAYDGADQQRQEYAYIHLQKRKMVRPSPEVAASDSWFITPRAFCLKKSATSTPAEMDKLNPGSLLYDLYRVACSTAWRAQWTLQQRVDPWPRRS